MAAHLEPTKKEKKFKLAFDAPSEGYVKIKGFGEFGTFRAEIRGEDVRITSFSTRIIVELYVIFFQFFNPILIRWWLWPPTSSVRRWR